MSPELIELIRGERSRAQAILEACDAFLTTLEPVPAVRTANRRKPPREPRTAKPARAAQAVPPAMRDGNAQAVAGDSKVARYGDAVLKILGHHSRAPHYSADSAVIRREVAAACGVNPEKDTSFTGDVSNALQRLKAQGRVERSGAVWALVKVRES